MLNQQDTFKVGEWAPEAGRYFCAACDRNSVESVVEVDASQPFPFCPSCKQAGRVEPDQLWIRLKDRDAFRQGHETRWRELWKTKG